MFKKLSIFCYFVLLTPLNKSKDREYFCCSLRSSLHYQCSVGAPGYQDMLQGNLHCQQNGGYHCTPIQCSSFGYYCNNTKFQPGVECFYTALCEGCELNPAGNPAECLPVPSAPSRFLALYIVLLCVFLFFLMIFIIRYFQIRGEGSLKRGCKEVCTFGRRSSSQATESDGLLKK